MSTDSASASPATATTTSQYCPTGMNTIIQLYRKIYQKLNSIGCLKRVSDTLGTTTK